MSTSIIHIPYIFDSYTGKFLNHIGKLLVCQCFELLNLRMHVFFEISSSSPLLICPVLVPEGRRLPLSLLDTDNSCSVLYHSMLCHGKLLFYFLVSMEYFSAAQIAIFSAPNCTGSVI